MTTPTTTATSTQTTTPATSSASTTTPATSEMTSSTVSSTPAASGTSEHRHHQRIEFAIIDGHNERNLEPHDKPLIHCEPLVVELHVGLLVGLVAGRCPITLFWTHP